MTSRKRGNRESCVDFDIRSKSCLDLYTFDFPKNGLAMVPPLPMHNDGELIDFNPSTPEWAIRSAVACLDLGARERLKTN